jgi:hypothetical protein
MADKQTETRAKRIAGNADRLEALRKKAEQAQNLLRAVESIAAEKQRALDTRRKVILGALLIDAAGKDERFSRVLSTLMQRIDREHDRQAFAGWTPPVPTAEEKTTPLAKASPLPAADTAQT